MAEETVGPMTQGLRTHRGSQTLRPIQAVALREAYELGGAFIMGRVGVGKTLVTLLAPHFLGAKRALILVPTADVQKTLDEFAEYRKNWQGAVDYRLEGYRAISLLPSKGKSIRDFWNGQGPDLIILDEAHKLRRASAETGASGLAMQMWDYLEENSQTKVIALTGTPERESLQDVAHILRWCLRDNAPVPDREDIRDWISVLDKGETKYARKVCKQLGVPATEDIDMIREAYRARLAETPGVIVSADRFELPLSVRLVRHEPRGMLEHFHRLRTLSQRPDGVELQATKPGAESKPDFVAAATVWAAARQASLGFFYLPDPKAPEDWQDARRLWFKRIRKALKERVFYTPLQVERAAIARELPKAWLLDYDHWKQKEAEFTPRFKPVWYSNWAIEEAKRWGEERPGIIFVDHVAFGECLSEETGWPYFRELGLDASGKSITREKGKRTVIASRHSCGTSKNLQMFDRMLFTACPSAGADIEQNIGRCHREEQKSKSVEVDIWMICEEHYESFLRCQEDAKRLTKKLMPQKLEYCEIEYFEGNLI